MKEKNYDLKNEFYSLIIKVGFILIIFTILFTVCFGITANPDDSMSPSMCEGDIVLYYRLSKSYQTNDTIVMKYKNRTITRRIVAIAGDTVDITDKGLEINGYVQDEKKIYTETLPYKHGIKFPITVKKDEVFVLADNRVNAQDSRVYGCIKIKNTFGKVMMIIRRRNF